MQSFENTYFPSFRSVITERVTQMEVTVVDQNENVHICMLNCRLTYHFTPIHVNGPPQIPGSLKTVFIRMPKNYFV